ncbi:MAG: hypothetical protein HYX48_06610 [Chlamydiales bacterium]|nr:hypothetical protein [Chlamydiales bacterium]
MASNIHGLFDRVPSRDDVGQLIGGLADLFIQAGKEVRSIHFITKEVIGSSTALTSALFAACGPVSEGDFMTPRGKYVEVGFISFVSTIYNLFLSGIFAIAYLFTRITNGESERMGFLCRKFLVIAGASSALIGAGVVGVFSPEYGKNTVQAVYNAIFEGATPLRDFLLWSEGAPRPAAPGGPRGGYVLGGR